MKLTRTAYTDQGTFGVLEGEGLRLFALDFQTDTGVKLQQPERNLK